MNVEPNFLAAALYKSLSDNEAPRKMQAWHASSIAQCPRAQFYARSGVPRLSKPTGAKILRWQAGHLIESVIRPHLLKQLPNLISNVRFTNKELDLTGEFDNYDPDSKALIEIKSVSHHAVKYRKVNDTRYHLRDEKQYLHHEYQQAAYVKLMEHPKTMLQTQMTFGFDPLTGKTFPQWPVVQIIYLYITLDGLLVPYSTPVNDEVMGFVDMRLTLLGEHWKAQTLPACICANESHPLHGGVLQWCDYKSGSGCCEEQLWNQFKLNEGKNNANESH